MVQYLGSAQIIIFTIFKLVPILWVSQYLSTIRYMEMYKLHYELTGHAVDEMPLQKHLSVLNSRRSSGTKGMSI